VRVCNVVYTIQIDGFLLTPTIFCGYGLFACLDTVRHVVYTILDICMSKSGPVGCAETETRPENAHGVIDTLIYRFRENSIP